MAEAIENPTFWEGVGVGALKADLQIETLFLNMVGLSKQRNFLLR